MTARSVRRHLGLPLPVRPQRPRARARRRWRPEPTGTSRSCPSRSDQVARRGGRARRVGRPGADTGLLALQVGVVVRDQLPDAFLAAHAALFAARHDEGRHIRERRGPARRARGRRASTPTRSSPRSPTGRPLETVQQGARARRRRAHASGACPPSSPATRPVFVRFMHRPAGRRRRSPPRPSSGSSTCSTAGPTSTSSSTPRSRAEPNAAPATWRSLPPPLSVARVRARAAGCPTPRG